MIFRVWDEFNADEDSAWNIEASDPCSAAIEYAERDSDGLCDGLYLGENGRELDGLDKGQPISVRDPDGVLHRFKVGITSFDPVYDAMEVT